VAGRLSYHDFMARLRARSRARPATPPPAAPRPAEPSVLPDVLAVLACAALACWVQRRALGVYFHPDDLISMEWARGILPAPEFGFWRLLSGRLFFMAALRAFGGNPVPYHVVNLALHVVNVTLVYALARRYGTPRSGALLAAGWFGSARPAFSVLQQAVGVGELLALGLAVSALLACGRSLLRRAAAALLFAAALLSKEIVVLAPLAALIPRQPGSLGDADAWRGRLLDAAPVFVVAVAASAVMALAGAGRHELAGEAYAMRWGPNLFHNLMTYVSWAFDLRNPFFDDPGRISTVAWHAGLPLLAALIALAWLVRRRTTLPLAGLTCRSCITRTRTTSIRRSPESDWRSAPDWMPPRAA